MVDEDYVLLPPAELTGVWDHSVDRPIETLGALQEGRCLFITMRLGTLGCAGMA